MLVLRVMDNSLGLGIRLGVKVSVGVVVWKIKLTEKKVDWYVFNLNNNFILLFH